MKKTYLDERINVRAFLNKKFSERGVFLLELGYSRA